MIGCFNESIFVVLCVLYIVLNCVSHLNIVVFETGLNLLFFILTDEKEMIYRLQNNVLWGVCKITLICSLKVF